MQPSVAFFQLSLALFATPVNAGVYAPSLLTGGSNGGSDDDNTVVVFRVLQTDKASPTKAASGCKDDASWVDEDGDGCAAYAYAIKKGLITQKVACGVEQPKTDDVEGDFQGAALHCPGTCGTCPAEPTEDVAAATPEVNEKDGNCVDDATWTDEDGDGCDVYAMHIQSGQLSRSVACGFEDAGSAIGSGDPQGAAQHCRATCGTCHIDPLVGNQMSDWMLNVAEQIVAESPEFDPTLLSSEPAEGEKACKDDPNWVDTDGDGCAVYARVIATGSATQAQVCGRAHMDLLSGNPGDAAKYCPVTCGNCHLEVMEDNDADMKDMIRLLVEQESENILKSAHLEEVVQEEEDTEEVTTTTTTAAKKLPEADCSTNSTWVEYWDPDAEEDEKELTQLDLLKMASDIKPQQSRWLQMLSSQ